MNLQKLGIFSIFLIFFSLNTYSYSPSCVNETNPYIVECTIPEQYFIQGFTCLNKNCSMRIENKQTHQNLIFPGKENSIILQKYIELKHIYPELELLNVLCEEQFSEILLSEINYIIEEKHSSLITEKSGEKIIIKPLEFNTLKDYSNQKNKDIDTLHECFITTIDIHENWVITSKERKKYCQTTFNSENMCFETTIKKSGFLTFIFSNPNSSTIPYLLFIFLFFSLIGSSILFSKQLRDEKKIKTFFKLNKTKIYLKLLLVIPLFYCIGIIVNSINSKQFYFYISGEYQILIIILSIIFLYILSAFIEYVMMKNK